MSVPLMRHQTQGYKWMREREAGKYKGGILADDMGLGKTIQALALISESDEDREEVELRGHATLIVAPVAVLRQWESEAKTKTDCGLRVFIHHGSSKATSASIFKKHDIVLTSFPTAASEYSTVASSDGDRRFSPLFKARWLRIILDEAHNIKNHTTKQALACFELARRSHSRWCLTGTPLQNNAMEMFSLIHFLGIPPFDDYAHFKEKIADPLKSSNQNRVNWGMKRLCVVLQSILLRRTKDTKLDGKPLLTLPDRVVEVVSEPFDNEAERAFYKSWEDQARRNLDREKNHIGKLLLLLRMRQATSHPSLVTKSINVDADALPANPINVDDDNDNDNDDSGDELADLMKSMRVDKAKCARCQCVLDEDNSGNSDAHCLECRHILADEARRQLDWTQLGSTKLRIMLRLLDRIDTESHGKEKTIIFSQFTTFLDLVELALRREGRQFVRYDGSMSAPKREVALETIRAEGGGGGGRGGTRIILISFKAGSTGLNLTCCSRVLLMDLWWNPMLEEQGMDRAHRVGQTRAVRMYKICIEDTVEQRILALQEKKRELSRAALEGSKLKKGGNKLSLKELMYLFNGGAGDEPPAPAGGEEPATTTSARRRAYHE
ncbi:hypothetical protein BDZ90DRAFT_241850 [Jaminaea rosea]|uniref:P-loop containing nucleoside triphosphate hydrolase protein n=1 Tax=Jaminaea rosea TaxID=1569628 RepID=A0A316UN23_9BASI|nr:hypothetical protein BDZ90DRAFT_241850 [Jaminaea rosea]PWN26650.1 hypothetical protein BDZ90DRAFT_241850 [Jaminaea rosea]